MTTPVVSVTVPVSQALEHVKRVLFRPLDAGKWFVIGFCAWLAFLGERGGFNFNFPGGGDHHGRGASEQARHFVMENLYWIIPLVAVLLVLGIAFGLVITWLNSRGKFMFLHCVALNKADVGEPWNKYAREGNSLFWFRVVLALVGAAVVLPVALILTALIIAMTAHHSWNPVGVLAVIGIALFIVAFALVISVIRKFTMDFVVPIMFLRGKGCVAGWREFGSLLTAGIGRFILYLLFQIVLRIAIGAMILAIVLMTCCVAGCFMAIPYLGTVLLLPVLVFKRSYSLFYLAQFGREYDVFAPAAPAA